MSEENKIPAEQQIKEYDEKYFLSELQKHPPNTPLWILEQFRSRFIVKNRHFTHSAPPTKEGKGTERECFTESGRYWVRRDGSFRNFTKRDDDKKEVTFWRRPGKSVVKRDRKLRRMYHFNYEKFLTSV